MRILASTLLLLGSSLIGMVHAHDYQAGDLRVQHPWSRPLPPVSPTGAAYMVIENHGQQPDALIGVSTPIAGHAELHEHVHQGDLMKMQQIERVEIAPGERVEFVPGGYHVMLFDLRQPLTADTAYALTLEFERAGELEVEVRVHEQPSPAAKRAAHDHHGQGHHH